MLLITVLKRDIGWLFKNISPAFLPAENFSIIFVGRLINVTDSWTKCSQILTTLKVSPIIIFSLLAAILFLFQTL